MAVSREVYELMADKLGINHKEITNDSKLEQTVIHELKGGNAMSVSERVELKNGQTKTIFADNKEDLAEAVKVAKDEEAPVYPNINRPVQKGHDQVAVGPDVSKVLVDGEGAHNSPWDAIDEDGNERGDDEVRARGLEEPAYKSVPVMGSSDQDPRTATEAEVKEAKGDSFPANEEAPKEDDSSSRKSSNKSDKSSK